MKERANTTESEWIWISAFAMQLNGLTKEQQKSEIAALPPDLAYLMPLVEKYRNLSLDLDRDRTNETIGGYYLVERIGEGGMGEVYRARELSELYQREVAVKLIRWPPTPSPKETTDRVSRFKAEVAKLSMQTSAHVVNLFKADIYRYDSGEIVPYLAMQYIAQSRSLKKYVVDVELKPVEILRLMTKVCRGIQHIHDLDIIHGDIKPENILVDTNGDPRVTDFGIAKWVGDAVPRGLDGMGEGTRAYMSPEQVTDTYGEITKKSDVYALGVILYELLAKKLPHELPKDGSPDKGQNEFRRRILEEEPAKLDSITRLYNGQVEAILNKALAKFPNDRFASADAMKIAIERVLTEDEEKRPTKLTAQQLYSQSCDLTNRGHFEQAAIKAEEAYAAAESECDRKLSWMASLQAARNWFHHLSTNQFEDATGQSFETKIANNIYNARLAGAPEVAVMLVRVLLTIHQRDYEKTLQLASEVLADISCEEIDRAEALAMKLQSLLFSNRLDEALSCNDEVRGYCDKIKGEVYLLLETTWLRILCESQMATEEDVLALPQNLWVKGSNISRMEAFGFFAFPR